jgi:hypothetical protein
VLRAGIEREQLRVHGRPPHAVSFALKVRTFGSGNELAATFWVI